MTNDFIVLKGDCGNSSIMDVLSSSCTLRISAAYREHSHGIDHYRIRSKGISFSDAFIGILVWCELRCVSWHHQMENKGYSTTTWQNELTSRLVASHYETERKKAFHRYLLFWQLSSMHNFPWTDNKENDAFLNDEERRIMTEWIDNETLSLSHSSWVCCSFNFF